MVTNCVIKRFKAQFVPVGMVGAGVDVNVDRAISASHGIPTGCIGIAVPVTGDMAQSFVNPIVRATSPTNLRLRFVNSSAVGRPQPPQTYNIFMFVPVGMTDQTV